MSFSNHPYYTSPLHKSPIYLTRPLSSQPKASLTPLSSQLSEAPVEGEVAAESGTSAIDKVNPDEHAEETDAQTATVEEEVSGL